MDEKRASELEFRENPVTRRLASELRKSREMHLVALRKAAYVSPDANVRQHATSLHVIDTILEELEGRRG